MDYKEIAIKEIKKSIAKLTKKVQTLKDSESTGVEYHGEHYESRDEALEWFGCGGISSRELEEIYELFTAKENNEEIIETNKAIDLLCRMIEAVESL